MIVCMVDKMFWFMVVVVALFGLCMFNYQYQAVRKYYPDLTLLDYVALQPYLRIVPDRND